MVFKSDLAIIWNQLLTKAVGPTTTTARVALPQPAPTDGNAIWLAPNGNDANAGTSALPKLTLSGAVAALTAGKPTVHIFRNGYVGDLNFTQATSVSLPASRNIQVEVGEKAKITFTTAARLTLNGTDKLNGIWFYTNENDTSLGLILQATGTNYADNCYIESNNYGFGWGFVDTSVALISTYTVFRGTNCVVGPQNTATDFFNCIFIAKNPALLTDTACAFDVQTAASAQIGFERCLFLGFQVCASNNSAVTVLANRPSLTFAGCDFIQCKHVGEVPEGSGSNIYYYRYYMQHCHAQLIGTTINTIVVTGSGTANILLDIQVPLDPRLPSLFVDFNAGLLGDQEGLRLQRLGKLASNGLYYDLDSPLIRAYEQSPGVFKDVNPWDESVSGPTRTYGATTHIDFDPKSLSIEPVPTNAVEKQSSTGSWHTRHDGLKRQFKFTFDTYSNNDQARRLINLLNDQGTIQFYLRELGESLFPDASIALYDSSDNSLAPVTTTPMIPGNWNGFWVTCGTKDFYIVRNDAIKLYLSDKLGVGAPGNPTPFSIQYMLVHVKPETIPMKQDNFTHFLRGGQWRETQGPIRSALEYNGVSITLLEAEDPEPNL